MGDIIIKNAAQIEGIRRSSRLAAATLDYIAEYVRAGVTTGYLDRMIDAFIQGHGALSATRGYNGFPASSCISPNEVVCHGIPSDHIWLTDGDIVNIDITTILDGYYGDTSRMFCIGEVSRGALELVETARHSLELGIQQVRPGNPFGNIGYVINRYVRSRGFSVVYEFCGHGVGIRFHEEPQVDHAARKNSGSLMQPGMIFTIEPMINQGKASTIVDKKDGWTARTSDRKLSAQFEHTVLVTPAGCEILTMSSEDSRLT